MWHQQQRLLPPPSSSRHQQQPLLPPPSRTSAVTRERKEIEIEREPHVTMTTQARRITNNQKSW